MGIVIIGGNECMVCQYEAICRHHGHTAKVFAKQHGVLSKKIGAPDLIILFTRTVSHAMVQSALCEARKGGIPVCRCRSSSAAALNAVLTDPQAACRAEFVH